MEKIFTIILTLLTISVFGQKNPTEKAQPIVAEGKLKGILITMAEKS